MVGLQLEGVRIKVL